MTEWTFNLRSTKTNPDSDSDSDSNDDAPANSISEESRLLNDFCLSNREEAVVYKPNPFSIAKINAASRPKRPSTPPKDCHLPKPAPKKATGRIVDCFNATKTSRPTAKKKETKTRTLVSGTPTSAHSAPSPNSIAGAATPMLNLIPQLPDAPSIPPVPAAQNLVEEISSLSMHTNPGPVSQHIPSPRTFIAHKVVPKKFRPPAPISFSSPLKAPKQGPWNQLSFSSPPRTDQSTLLSPVHATSMFNTFLRKNHYPLPPGKSKQTFQTQRTNLTPNITDSRPSPAPNLTLAREHYISTPSTSTSDLQLSIPSASINAGTRDQRVPVPVTHELAETRQFRSKQTSVYRPQSSGVGRQHDLNLPPHFPLSSPIQSPIPTPKPSPRRKRELARKHLSTKPNRTLKRRGNDAYDYVRSDPDDEWSTLPARKKAKIPEQIKVKINGIKTTAAFRLPGASTKGKVSGMSAASERRVVTFLPPPLKVGKVQVGIENVEESESLRLDVAEASASDLEHCHESSPPTFKRPRLSDNPYPSPANSRMTSDDGVASAFDVLDVSALDGPSSRLPAQLSRHRIPSPPTSDPLAEYDSDANILVTVSNVSQRYTQTKIMMRKRKHGSNCMWDLLDLPSCGIVHHGEHESPGGELPVIV
ncbi:hypothetical protein C8R43DRAFT_1233633, partial [Mycena crocata]